MKSPTRKFTVDIMVKEKYDKNWHQIIKFNVYNSVPNKTNYFFIISEKISKLKSEKVSEKNMNGKELWGNHKTDIIKDNLIKGERTKSSIC